PTNGRHNLAFSLSFLERSLFDHRYSRSAGGAQCCHPEFSNHRLALLPSALSLWSYCSGASWVSSIGNGCRLGRELNVAVSSKLVPGACRSHPNSAICFESCQAAFFPTARRF